MIIDLHNIGYLFDVGYIIALTVYGVNLMISKAMLGKITHKRVRGTMFAIGGLCDSFSIAFSSWVGGIMYRDATRYSPLIITAVLYGVASLYTIYYGLTGKLNL